MKAKFNKQTSDVGASERANEVVRQSRTATHRVVKVAAAFLLAVTSTGCAASNYDFDALSDASSYARAVRLSEDWVSEKNEGEDDSLYDVHVVPFAHTSLNVYTESEDEGIPEGFVEADIDSYLPLFGFVDVDVKRYDRDHNLYEQQEYNSYFWGLFQTHRELVETELGSREEKGRRFLWFFGWTSSPKYIGSTS